MVRNKVCPDTATSLMHEAIAHPPSPSNENHAGPLAHDSEAVVRTMEAEYIDMTGGFISPLNDSIEVSLFFLHLLLYVHYALLFAMIKTADSAAHTRQAQSIPESTLSSTQQAVVDSQSEVGQSIPRRQSCLLIRTSRSFSHRSLIRHRIGRFK